MKDQRIRIGFDVDQVLADFILAFQGLAERLKGQTFSESKEWSFSDWGITKKDLDTIWDRIRETRDFWAKLPVCKDARRAEMIQLDHRARLFFITSRVPTSGPPAEKQTAWWLWTYLGITHPTVLVTQSDEEKGILAKALQLDYFIDDKLSNVEAVIEHSPNTRVYLRSTGQNLQLKTWVPRVDNLSTFIRELNDRHNLELLLPSQPALDIADRRA